MEGRWIGGTAVAVIVAIIMMVVKSGNKSSAEKDIRYDMHEVIASSEAYRLERDYVEMIFNAAHKKAFEHNYRMGGRYSSSSFRTDNYVDEVLEDMIRRAKSDKHAKVATALGVLWNDGPAPKK